MKGRRKTVEKWIYKRRADFLNGAFVLFHLGKFQQVLAVRQPLFQIIDGCHNTFEGGALLAKLLGVIRITPDVGVFQFAGDFL